MTGEPRDEERDVPPSRVPEPYDAAETARPHWWMMMLAGVVALIGSLVAPDSWPEGDGELAITYRDEMVATRAVTVGAGERLDLGGPAGEVDVQATLPGGVSTAEAIEGWVSVSRDGERLQPGLDEVELTVTLSDGRSELIPVLKWDSAERRLEVARRPPVHSAVVLGLLGFVVVLWVTEAVPLFVTSLAIPVVLVVSEVGSAADALAPFFHPIIALFFGGFLMAEAMRRVRLDRLAALSIVARAGRSPVALFAAMLGVSAFLSMWMSNTAATAVLVPIALAVTEPIGHLGYRKAVVLGIAYAATIGGVGSAIGTPANPLAIAFLETFVGRRISFSEWFAFGLPMVVLFLPVMGWVLWKRSKVHVDRPTFAETRRVAASELEQTGRPTRDQMVVLGVFGMVVLVWLTQTWHGVNTGIVAIAGAVALAALGRILPSDLGRISWASLLTFGGGLTLGVFLVESGSSDWLATRLTGLAGLPALVGMGAVALLALGLTTVASNTASAAMLVPLAIPLAGVLGIDPTLLVVVVAIASSVDFALVIGTPPTMIAYSTRLYTTREIFTTGFALDLAGITILITAVVGLWGVLGIL